MGEYCQILISAPDNNQAKRISDILIVKRLVAGSLITKGQSRYWWKNKLVSRQYYNVSAFSLMKHKNSIIKEIKKIHKDVL
jgi:uncharacterized protein involved in tolerance to divalent cations